MTEPAGNAAGEWDALVIGAGAGGLFTAARLAHLGYRTLVVERLGKVGGRASTDDIDGFKVNNGAIVIETGGITEQTCREVGAAFGIREPSPPQRAVAGFDLPFRTPVANLWNVGDGVKEYANGGTTACAETAKLVADQIAARFPLAAQPEGGR
jgi:monoamine oxidase